MSVKRTARENGISKPKNQSKPPKNAYLIAQDIKFAKVLACNDKKLRDRALKSLKKWFQHRTNKLAFTEEDFMRIWKGLFYSMWMSDKPLIQEEVAENIAQLVHFTDLDASLLFFKTGLLTLIQQWNGIDQLRLDKFLMFARRFLRQGITVLKNHKFKANVVVKFGNILTETVLNTSIKPPLGLTMHLIDIYWEEIAKVSEGKIHPSLVTQFVQPFVTYLAILNDKIQINHLKENIFHYLLKQSDTAAAYEERFEAWKQMGFPGGTIDAITKEYVDEQDAEEEIEETETVLDPRAGRVDVVLPRLKFSSKEIAKLLQEHKFDEGSNTKSKKAISLLVQQFKEMSKGNYPLGTKKLNIVKDNDGYSTKLKHSVNRLVKFEKKLMGKEQNKHKNKKRKAEQEETPLESPKKKKKRKSIVSNGTDDSAHDFFQKKLEDFIMQSEGSANKKRKTKKAKQIIPPGDFEYSFRRNSGTWFVFNDEKETTENTTQENVPNKILSPKTNDVQTPEEVKSPKVKQLFSTDEWDSPLQDGEIEIFIPNKRTRKSLDKINSSLTDDYENNKILVKNPFSKNGSPPSSTKKVKIDLKLNRSQEFHEHHAQILSSPGIPFDASKKPLKPLLKPTAVSTPINPFYKKKKIKMADLDLTF